MSPAVAGLLYGVIGSYIGKNLLAESGSIVAKRKLDRALATFGRWFYGMFRDEISSSASRKCT